MEENELDKLTEKVCDVVAVVIILIMSIGFIGLLLRLVISIWHPIWEFLFKKG